MSAKIINFTENAIENDELIKASREVAIRIAKYYPRVPVALAEHAALITFSKRALDEVDELNWIDAESAVALIGIPYWETIVDPDEPMMRAAVPIGVLCRLATMLDHALPMTLLGVRVRSEDGDDPVYRVFHTDTEEFDWMDTVELEDWLDDPKRFELTQREVDEVREYPNKCASRRLDIIGHIGITKLLSEKDQNIISGFAGKYAEISTGDASRAMGGKVNRLVDEVDVPMSKEEMILDMFDSLHETDRDCFSGIDEFREAVKEFVGGEESEVPPSTDKDFQRELMGMVLNEEEEEEGQDE
jgi:hypothetical protein